MIFEWTRELETDTKCSFQDMFGDEKGDLSLSKKGWSCTKYIRLHISLKIISKLCARGK